MEHFSDEEVMKVYKDVMKKLGFATEVCPNEYQHDDCKCTVVNGECPLKEELERLQARYEELENQIEELGGKL